MHGNADFLHFFLLVMSCALHCLQKCMEKYQQLPNRLAHFKQSFHFAAPHDDRSTMIFSVSLSPERSRIRHKFMIHFRYQEKFGRNGRCTLCVQLERRLKPQLPRSARIVYITNCTSFLEAQTSSSLLVGMPDQGA